MYRTSSIAPQLRYLLLLCSLLLIVLSYRSEAQMDSLLQELRYPGYIGYINADCLADTVIYTASTTGSTTGAFVPSRIVWGVATMANQNICTNATTHVPDNLKVSSTSIVYPTWAGLQVSLSVDRINPEDTLSDLMFFLRWHPGGQDSVDTVRAIVVFGGKTLVTIATLDLSTLGSSQTNPFYAKDLKVGRDLLEEEPRDLTDSYSYFFKPVIPLPVDIVLDGTVVLEGNFNTSTQKMEPSLQLLSLLPSTQPYTGFPYFYNGTETMGSVPDSSIIDWILIETRTGTTSATILERRAGLLRFDGKIVKSDGVTPFWLPGVDNGSDSCYIVIRHRNHLAVMSAVKVAGGTTANIQYDFTGSTAVFSPSAAGSKLLVGSIYGMMGGDVDGNGIIDVVDRTEITNHPGYGYTVFDISLDGIANAIDRVLARNNVFHVTQVP